MEMQKFALWSVLGMRLSIAAHITGIKFGSCQVKKCQNSPADVKATKIEGKEAEKSKAAKRKAHHVHGILEFCAQAAAALATPVPGKTFAPSEPLNAHLVRNNPSWNLQVIVK